MLLSTYSGVSSNSIQDGKATSEPSWWCIRKKVLEALFNNFLSIKKFISLELVSVVINLLCMCTQKQL